MGRLLLQYLPTNSFWDACLLHNLPTKTNEITGEMLKREINPLSIKLAAASISHHNIAWEAWRTPSKGRNKTSDALGRRRTHVHMKFQNLCWSTILLIDGLITNLIYFKCRLRTQSLLLNLRCPQQWGKGIVCHFFSEMIIDTRAGNPSTTVKVSNDSMANASQARQPTAHSG